MKPKVVTLMVLGLLLGSSGIAYADLISRLGGTVIYDTDRDISWMADANYAATTGFSSNGGVTWYEAVAFKNLVNQGLYENYGVNNWRLPTTVVTDPCGGFFGCRQSEMGHLFYDELGGRAGLPVTYNGDGLIDPDVALFRNIVDSAIPTLPGEPFVNGIYWSSTADQFHPGLWWGFVFQNGLTTAGPGENHYVAWLVRDGDVVSVPEPITLVLLGTGLAGLVAVRKRLS